MPESSATPSSDEPPHGIDTIGSLKMKNLSFQLDQYRDRLRTHYERTLEDRRRENQKTFDRVAKEHLEELADLRKTHQKAFDKERKDHDLAFLEQEGKHQEELARLEKRCNDLETKLANAQNEARVEYREAVDAKMAAEDRYNKAEEERNNAEFKISLATNSREADKVFEAYRTEQENALKTAARYTTLIEKAEARIKDREDKITQQDNDLKAKEAALDDKDKQLTERENTITMRDEEVDESVITDEEIPLLDLGPAMADLLYLASRHMVSTFRNQEEEFPLHDMGIFCDIVKKFERCFRATHGHVVEHLLSRSGFRKDGTITDLKYHEVWSRLAERYTHEVEETGALLKPTYVTVQFGGQARLVDDLLGDLVCVRQFADRFYWDSSLYITVSDITVPES